MAMHETGQQQLQWTAAARKEERSKEEKNIHGYIMTYEHITNIFTIIEWLQWTWIMNEWNEWNNEWS